MKANEMSNKKAKNEDWESQEFDDVRHFLIHSRFGSTHPGIIAALRGIDEEVKRCKRDTKLHQKFASARPVGVPTGMTRASLEDCDTDAVKVEHESMTMTDTDDWQDVTEEDDTLKQHNSDDDAYSTSYLGSLLAKEAVASLAAHKVLCASPTAALAVALHAALLRAGFACTGVPETASSGGFAAPIRDLPPGQFLPSNWENAKADIKLRYRKEGTGSIVLAVSPIGDAAEPHVQVSLAPTLPKEPNPLQFPVTDHINLDSWDRARKDKPAVSPALHYKALATLLTKFAQHFDLGTIDDHVDSKQQPTPGAATNASPYVDYTMLQNRQFLNMNHPTTLPRATSDPTGRFNGPDISVFHDRTASARPSGDFAGDLTPTGIFPYPGGMPEAPGNLMGPNHPMFNGVGGGGMAGVGPNSGFGMKPRFDPYGPPGGPTEPEDPDNLLRNPMNNVRLPGGTGNPNNDLERPPSLNSNKFF
jgi:PI31 proteasome regulator N-terminal